MNKKLISSAVATMALYSTGFAAGELNIFNWGNYTTRFNEKFEKQYDKSHPTDYDSNDTALAKLLLEVMVWYAVPSNSYVPIWMKKILLIHG